MSGKNPVEAFVSLISNHSDVPSNEEVRKKRKRELDQKYRDKLVLDPDSETWMTKREYKVKENQVEYLINPVFTLSDEERERIRETSVFPESFFKKKLVCDYFYRDMKGRSKSNCLYQVFKDDEDIKNKQVRKRTKSQKERRASLMQHSEPHNKKRKTPMHPNPAHKMSDPKVLEALCDDKKVGYLFKESTEAFTHSAYMDWYYKLIKIEKEDPKYTPLLRVFHNDKKRIKEMMAAYRLEEKAQSNDTSKQPALNSVFDDEGNDNALCFQSASSSSCLAWFEQTKLFFDEYLKDDNNIEQTLVRKPLNLDNEFNEAKQYLLSKKPISNLEGEFNEAKKFLFHRFNKPISNLDDKSDKAKQYLFSFFNKQVPETPNLNSRLFNKEVIKIDSDSESEESSVSSFTL